MRVLSASFGDVVGAVAVVLTLCFGSSAAMGSQLVVVLVLAYLLVRVHGHLHVLRLVQVQVQVRVAVPAPAHTVLQDPRARL